MSEFNVVVIRGDCEHVMHSQEQLDRFVKAGWTVKEAPKESPKKKAEKADK